MSNAYDFIEGGGPNIPFRVGGHFDVVNVHWTSHPWYWWIPTQQPLAFSIFGEPPEDADPKWTERGTLLLPYIPVVWILSENYPLMPIPQIGYDTLADAVDFGVPDVSAWVDGRLPYNAGRDGSDWGIIPFTQSPLPTSTGPAPPFGPEFNVTNTVPNIWQLVNLPQPFKRDHNGNLVLDNSGNPIPINPTGSDAEKAAKTFETYWNAACDGQDGVAESYVPTGPDPVGGGGPGRVTYPANWKFAFPWHNNLEQGYFGAFQAGCCTGFYDPGIPVELIFPAGTATKLKVGQLDPNVWDTSRFPPVRWPKPKH